MLTAPLDHPLNLVTQAILTWASYGLSAVLLVFAVRMGLRQKTPFYVLIMLAAAFAALFEPLYDAGFMLLFYVPGMWSTFSAFDVLQPVWTHSGYVVLYAGPAIFICDRIRAGLTRQGLWAWAIGVLVCSCVFEMFGIVGGAYSSWGPHALRILQYPLVIGVLETAQVLCFSVAAAEFRKRIEAQGGNWLPLLGLFVLFPCMFYFANFGAGAPVIVALHTQGASAGLVLLANLVSIGFALLLVQGASQLLPSGALQAARGRLGQGASATPARG